MQAVAVDEAELEASLCRESLVDFVKAFWDEVPGASPVIWNWHIDVLCEELQRIAERVFKGEPKKYDEIVNIPPGTSKSTICSILFPCWIWTRMPTARVMCASHTDTLVLDLANKARDVIRSDKYQKLFPEIQLKKSQDTKGYYSNIQGGDRFSCTVQGKTPTGFHASLIIVDDPLDPKRAASSVELKTARDFITNYVFSRKVEKSVTATILIMQRVHREDPTGALLENAKKEGAAKVRHIKLPGQLYRGEDGGWVESRVSPQELAKRYIDGLLDPARMPLSVLNEFRVTMGAYAYASQFDQEPVPIGGGLFKPQYFNQRKPAAPFNSQRVLYIDRASTADGGCFTAMVLTARDKEGNFYVEHVVRGQWEPVERNARIKAECVRCRDRYGPNHEPSIYVEAEGGSSGRDAWKALAKELAGFKVYEDRPTGSKDVRAEPWSVQLAAGNVWLIQDGTWDIAAYVEEHCSFAPEGIGKRLGSYKDQVDASSGAFNILLGRKNVGVGQFRIHSTSMPAEVMASHIQVIQKREGLRFLVCSDKDDLREEEPCLLVSILSHSEVRDQSHGLEKLLERLELVFDDVQPSENQEGWDSPLRNGRTCAESQFQRDQAKKLWAMLLKKREKSPQVIIFQDGGDRRALSLCMAVADVLRRPRNMIRIASEPDKMVGEADGPPNKHIYDLTKLGRQMVYG